MIAATLAMRGAGGALLAAGVVGLVGRRHARPRRRGGLPSVTARLTAWYDRSRRGRRLQARLDTAAFDLRPSQWRGRQTAAAVTAAGAMTVLSGSLPAGIVLGGTMARAVAWLLLRTRRGRRDDRLEEDSAVLARHLATELSAGASAAEALAMLRGGTLSRERPHLAAIAGSAAARCAGGEAPAPALHRALEALPAGRGREAMASVTTALDLVVSRGAGTAVLARLATAIELRRRTRAEVRALGAEVRMASLAIPALTGGAALMLVLADPGIAAAAATPAIAALSLLLMALIAAGTVVARRVTAPEG